MKTQPIVLLLCGLLAAAGVSAQTVNFDRAWQFGLLDSNDVMQEAPRTVNLPHDWSIEGSYAQANGDWQSGFLPCGKALYTKTFDAPEGFREKLTLIHFDGIYRCSDVWINGHHLGFRPNGFLGVEYDMTPYLKEKDNLLKVRVDHSQHFSNRSYTGSGIYRHTWLKSVDRLHVVTDGVFFSSRGKRFRVEVETANAYDSDMKAELRLSLTDPASRQVAQLVQPLSMTARTDCHTTLFEGELPQVEWWSPDSPRLYGLRIEILHEGVVKDCREMKVGFRDIEFSADKGFLINGRQLKIKGVCERSTAGALGAAVPDDVLRSRLLQLKEMGCNAIRTSHHPFAPDFYRMCDSLGLMVMDEMFDGWEKTKAREDYGMYFEEWWRTDATAFIRRDRSHPCVIVWSIGNEVFKPTRETQKKIIDLFKAVDPTRLTTQGGTDPTRGMDSDGRATQLGVKGFNGDGEEIGVFENFHRNFPETPLIGTEVPHTLQTRGVYRTRTHWRKFDFPAVWEQRSKRRMSKEEHMKKVYPIEDLTAEELFPEEICEHYYRNGKYYPIKNNLPKTTYYQSSYDNASVRISARKSWRQIATNDYLSGSFRWTGFDYLGESNGWPSRFMNCGVIDVCGIPKDHFYLYQSLWSDRPMVHLLPHWTHTGKEGRIVPVVAYSNAEQVELWLNGRSLGVKENNPDTQMVWEVPYEKGEIRAVAYNNGKAVASDSERSAEAPRRLLLTADRKRMAANGTDVVRIEVSVCDRHNTLCPMADVEVDFEITGGGRLIGTDNGDPLDLSDYKTPHRRTFRGKAVLWVQSDGSRRDIGVAALSPQLKSDRIRIGIR